MKENQLFDLIIPVICNILVKDFHKILKKTNFFNVKAFDTQSIEF